MGVCASCQQQSNGSLSSSATSSSPLTAPLRRNLSKSFMQHCEVKDRIQMADVLHNLYTGAGIFQYRWCDTLGWQVLYHAEMKSVLHLCAQHIVWDNPWRAPHCTCGLQLPEYTSEPWFCVLYSTWSQLQLFFCLTSTLILCCCSFWDRFSTLVIAIQCIALFFVLFFVLMFGFFYLSPHICTYAVMPCLHPT